ncbi:MAG: GNAT family N-acetyltransferase [Oscillospiraceae bacterium]|nr:GNAT family N-acetyltransferase [Oscillospiraceae bacterium]
MQETLPAMIAWSRGEQLKEGYVPETDCFLYLDGEAVGVFKLRHHLNDFLRNGPGHIGYGLLPQYRGKGLATAGLKLALEYIGQLLPEDEREVYFSVRKDNPASLRVQQNCGAYIHHEDETEYYTRIPRP